MSRPLPQVIDASVAADRRDRLEGRVRVSSFTRLDGLLQSNDGELDVSVAFDSDGEGCLSIDGRVRGELTLQCQRCLEPLNQKLDFELSLVLLGESDDGRDMIFGDPRRLELTPLIEDELLLALPLAPKHAEHDCAMKVEPVELGRKGEDSRQPFVALKELIGDG